MFQPSSRRSFGFLSSLFGFGAKPVRPKVFMDIKIEGQPKGRLVIELYSDKVPKTAENFRRLCIGDAGLAKSLRVPLHYKGTPFHRIVPGFMCQGGDITRRNGMGGESIYGPQFEDENFKVPHNKVGTVSMANRGPNTNGSQFFITTKVCNQLNGGYVAFGQLIEGFDLLEEMEACGTKTDQGTPTKKIIISNCGELKPEPETKSETQAQAGEEKK